MIRHLLLAASVLTLAATGLASGTATAQAEGTSRLPLEGIAAIVNDKPISYSDVRQRARFMLLGMGGQQPTQEQIQQITGQALEQLIDENLQMQKASEFELEIAPEEVSASVAQMAGQGGLTEDSLRQQLLAAGVNPSSLEDQMRAEIAWSRIMSGLYGSRIRISDNQVEDRLSRLRLASKKTQYRVSEIFLYAPDPETLEQATQAAGTIVTQLRQGADFRVAAQRLSSAPTAATGGDMGWVSPDDLAEELAAAVSEVSQPGILDPIIVSNGLYILQVANKREPTKLTTKVDLIRLATSANDDTDLKAAIETIQSCDDVKSVANSKSSLRASSIEDINVDDLGPEGKASVLATDVGSPTEITVSTGGLAVLYVCDRREGAEALPSRDELKDSLKNEELGMISQRELRDMRREATILYN
ncbi:MAG: SurA N-terminal domain-containing protein [Hyphomonas sp.]